MTWLAAAICELLVCTMPFTEVGADPHNSRGDEDYERDQERVLDQILAVFFVPPCLQQLHSCLPPRLLQPIAEGRSRKLPLDTVPLRLLVGIVSYP